MSVPNVAVHKLDRKLKASALSLCPAGRSPYDRMVTVCAIRLLQSDAATITTNETK